MKYSNYQAFLVAQVPAHHANPRRSQPSAKPTLGEANPRTQGVL